MTTKIKNNTRQTKNSASRRQFIKNSTRAAALAGTLAHTDILWSAEEIKLNGRAPFVLYLHFGSICGAASGLAQPTQAGKWPKGFFTAGADGDSLNPLLNDHTQKGSLVFHGYNHFLEEIADHMCLVNGTPVSLDHNVAIRLRHTGSPLINSSPEWAMAIAENSKTAANPNPFCITGGNKTMSTQNITTAQSSSVADFKAITSDAAHVPSANVMPIWETLKSRFQTQGMGSVKLPQGFGKSVESQLSTLTNGLPELNAAQNSIDELTAAMNETNFSSLISNIPDSAGISGGNAGLAARNSFRDMLILAGTLAKTKLASGMSFNVGGEDLHNGGSDVGSARRASQYWALITLLWKWVIAQGLDKDFTIIVSHDFGRTAYNSNRDISVSTVTAAGTQDILSPGRDHGLHMGMMFINSAVPPAARIGNIVDNFTAVAGTDKAGNFDETQSAFVSSHIVGSMFMRLYPGLFPTERIIRKHWPDFKEIKPIIEG